MRTCGCNRATKSTNPAAWLQSLEQFESFKRPSSPSRLWICAETRSEKCRRAISENRLELLDCLSRPRPGGQTTKQTGVDEALGNLSISIKYFRTRYAAVVFGVTTCRPADWRSRRRMAGRTLASRHRPRRENLRRSWQGRDVKALSNRRKSLRGAARTFRVLLSAGWVRR